MTTKDKEMLNEKIGLIAEGVATSAATDEEKENIKLVINQFTTDVNAIPVDIQTQ